MKSSTWLWVILVLLVLTLAWVGTNISKDKTTPEVAPTNQASQEEVAPAGVSVEVVQGNIITIAAPENIVVEYKEETGFEPRMVTITKGQTVTWKNLSQKPMWVASAMHPTHAVYPTTGGCLGSTFDACKSFDNGESWSFKFDYSGEWKYHDHRDPTRFGTVAVQ